MDVDIIQYSLGVTDDILVVEVRVNGEIGWVELGRREGVLEASNELESNSWLTKPLHALTKNERWKLVDEVAHQAFVDGWA